MSENERIRVVEKGEEKLRDCTSKNSVAAHETEGVFAYLDFLKYG